VRLLAFSDLHRDRAQAARLVERSHEADVVIGAGDFAQMRLGLQGIIDALSQIDRPTILVPGNNESEEALHEAAAQWPNAAVLHGTAQRIKGQTFFGLGGGVPSTPFPWSWDLTEDEARARLNDCPPDAVMIVHSPPLGYVDQALGRHLGSTAILEAIEAKQPKLVLTGHIHQSQGKEATINGTRVVNLGPEGRLFEV
jgi:Icc-related predicted phosphoesterase